MAASLIDKIRAARETVIEAGGFEFTIRRPTELEMIELRDQPRARGALRYVTGWAKVKESDLLPSGGPDLLEFDADVCAEWLTDRLDLLKPVVDGVFGAFDRHAEKREGAAKN